MYRENGICTLREEKTYKTPVERCTVMKSSKLYDLCANILKMDKLTFKRMLIVCVDNRYIPRAVFEMGNASHDYCSVSQSALLTKILLTGHSPFCESDKSLDRATGEAPRSKLNKLSKPLDRHPKHPL